MCEGNLTGYFKNNPKTEEERTIGKSEAVFGSGVEESVRYGVARVVEVEPIPHSIDLDAHPNNLYRNRGWTVKEHLSGSQIGLPCGQLDWWKHKLNFSHPDWFNHGDQMNPSEFWEKLKEHGEPVLNANVLDYLLKHPELVFWELDHRKDPVERTHFSLFAFWGTLFENRWGQRTVRALTARGGSDPYISDHFLDPELVGPIEAHEPVRLA